MKAPILKSDRVILRPIKIEDAATFIKWLKDKEVSMHLLVQKAPPLAEEKKWIKMVLAAKDKVVWGVYTKENELIGNTYLGLDSSHKCATFGIMIGEKEYWGQGYAGETLGLLKKYVFERLKFVRFELMYHENNLSARRAYDKAGFVVEGKKRKSHLNRFTKQFVDKIVMSIVDTDYFKK